MGGTIVNDCRTTKFKYLIILLDEHVPRSIVYYIALARGALVLHPDFLVASKEAQSFVSTDNYEYGNKKYIRAAESLDHWTAPYKWKLTVAAGGWPYLGAFAGCTFVLEASEEEIKQYRPILESGGGTVIIQLINCCEQVLKDYLPYCVVSPNKLSHDITCKLSMCQKKPYLLRDICSFLMKAKNCIQPI